MRQGVTQLQLCLYLSVEHLRSGRLRERGPAGRLTVAEAKCDNGLGQACGCRPGKGEQREKRHSLCVNSPRCSVSTTLSLTPTPKHTSHIPMTQVCTHTCTHTHMPGLPWWLSGKESACQCRRHGFDPWVRKIPWKTKWQTTPVFLPGRSHGQRSLVSYSPRGCESKTPLST